MNLKQSVVLLFLLLPFSANASTINFDGVPSGVTLYTEDGYSMDSTVAFTNSSSVMQYPIGHNTGTYYAINSLTSGFILTNDAESAFDVTSIDLGKVYNYDTSVGVDLRGYDALNNLVTSDLFNVTSLLSTFSLIGYQGLTRLEVDGNSRFAFDSINVNVSAVPLPAAAWLFGSALLGFVGFARRKSV